MRIGILLAFAIIVVSYGAAAWATDYEVRTIDGSENNLLHPEYGSVGTTLLRKAGVGYEDRIEAPGGTNRSSTRLISNILAAQGDEIILNSAGVSDFLWQWGQFIDHDLDLTPGAYPAKPMDIPVPTGDLYFDPYYEGDKYIGMDRSIHDGGSTRRFPRQQLNMITAFIDASNIYGSDQERADVLRSFEGGKLNTSGGGHFLPFNTTGLDNAGGPDPKLFLAGDVRANEQIALTAVHTLFVREHNRLCGEIAADPSILNANLTDEQIYQRARKIVGAQLQVITYREFLPLLLGRDALPPYLGYVPDVNPGIANEFSTVAYRFGHSMLSPTLLRVNLADNQLVETSLKDAFFTPLLIHQGGGISPILHGLATQMAQEVDTRVVDGIRNFLFGEPGREASTWLRSTCSAPGIMESPTTTACVRRTG
jgi:peroxidase